ncbi:MAG: hypothetical protein ACOVK9_02635, partial [Bacteroidia bacterium]
LRGCKSKDVLFPRKYILTPFRNTHRMNIKKLFPTVYDSYFTLLFGLISHYTCINLFINLVQEYYTYI